MFIFGGQGKDGFFNDLWMCDLFDCSWRRVKFDVLQIRSLNWSYSMYDSVCEDTNYDSTSQSSDRGMIEARTFHNAWLDCNDRELYILGGHNSNYEALNDCFKIQLPNGLERKALRSNLNQFWRLGISSDCEIVCQS